jgi:hypothetical protein
VRYILNRRRDIKEEAENYYKRYAPDDMPMEALAFLLAVFADTSNKQSKSASAGF